MICRHAWSEETHEGVPSRFCHVCNEWEIEVEYDRALLAIHNVAALAKRLRKTDPENAAHLLRFCREAGWEDSILRNDT
jgi:hypothetical protein